MGTRSLTRVFETDGAEILCLYRQFDGYPEGHGKELVEFLSGGIIVNGLGLEPANVFNGMGCLAAQLVAHFKKGPGGFYIEAPGTKGVSEEYEYHVRAGTNGKPRVEIFEVGLDDKLTPMELSSILDKEAEGK